MRPLSLLTTPALVLWLAGLAAAQSPQSGVPSRPSQLTPLAPPGGPPAQYFQTTQPGVPSRPSQLSPLALPGGPAQATQANQPGVPSRAYQLTPPGQTVPSVLPGFTVPLYRNPNVARTLGLTPQQVQKLNVITLQLQTSYSPQLGKLNALSQAERAARTQQLIGQYNAQWNHQAAAVLNQQQMTRYGQLDIQSRGLQAFGDQAVQQQLKLTPRQRQEFQSLLTQANQQTQQFQRTRWQNSSVAAQLADIYQRQWWQTASNILQPAQRTLWTQMTGTAP